MSTKDAILLIMILVLFSTTIVFGVRSSTNREMADDAREMGDNLVQVLYDLDYHRAVPECRQIGRRDFSLLANCLKTIHELEDLTGIFRETDFKDANPSRNTTGYIVIQNYYGGESFESRKFALTLNNELIGEGCIAPGEIAPGFSCRFDLERSCEPGDNLLVTYDGMRAVLKTC